MYDVLHRGGTHLLIFSTFECVICFAQGIYISGMFIDQFKPVEGE